MPVWPAIWPGLAVFVPLPGGGDLVCIVVVSPEWQLAVLLPTRADLEWLLAYLRRLTPGPISSIHPPVAARTADSSERGAIDWRSGDVVLAFQCGGTEAMYEVPVFQSPEHVRYSAVWNYDFIVQCKLTLLIWRVGRHPSDTEMPPPVRWVAAAQAFTGRFGVKFPGRWVPVFWAHTDKIAMCPCADSPDHCNVIFEQCDNMRLSGDCITVSSSSGRFSISQMTGIPPEKLTLLGQGTDTDEFPPLRNGDVIFHEVSGTAAHASRLSSRLLLVTLGCWFSRWACPLLLVHVGGSHAPGWDSGDAVTGQSAESVPQSAPLQACRRMLLAVLAQLSHYLSARGAPTWERDHQGWTLDMSSVLQLQASLHRLWWSRDLRDGFPSSFPTTYHAAWGSFPKWTGGVPDSVLIATDGSGVSGGSWAFIVWACFHGTWYRLGWDNMALASTPWLKDVYSDIPPFMHSYTSELAALQAAAIWCTSSLDTWQFQMGAGPSSVTLVGDNVAALQVAAGSGTASGHVAAGTRILWQAVQSRVNTHFRHVHSHVGVMANTLVDALASLRCPCPLAYVVAPPQDLLTTSSLLEWGPYLWLVPRSQLREGKPVLLLPVHEDADGCSHPALTADTAMSTPPTTPPGGHGRPDTLSETPARPSPPLPMHILTANVQTMRDAPSSIFNPSGHAARRQFLLQQAEAIPCDILCIQEAPSRAGRWATGGWLSWRSGHLKGQYGCEVWVRPGLVRPALGLED